MCVTPEKNAGYVWVRSKLMHAWTLITGRFSKDSVTCVEASDNLIAGVSQGIAGVPWAVTNCWRSKHPTKEKEEKTQVRIAPRSVITLMTISRISHWQLPCCPCLHSKRFRFSPLPRFTFFLSPYFPCNEISEIGCQALKPHGNAATQANVTPPAVSSKTGQQILRKETRLDVKCAPITLRHVTLRDVTLRYN